MAIKNGTKEQLDYVVWESVKGYEGFYEVSNTGIVRGLQRTIIVKPGVHRIAKAKILTFKFDKNGYARVQLSKSGKRQNIGVHRLVLEAFIQNPNNKPIPNHLNGIKYDNRLSNLEWSTYSENRLHSYRVLGVKIHFKKKIKQYSLSGIFIKNWDSATDAARDLKMSRECIRDNLIGKQKKAQGFIWKYVS